MAATVAHARHSIRPAERGEVNLNAMRLCIDVRREHDKHARIGYNSKKANSKH